jgi:hypothetical protein
MNQSISTNILKRPLTILVIFILLLSACEVNNYNPENYWPQAGDRIDMVENFWGSPDDRESFYEGDLLIVTYYYYDEGVYIDFVAGEVDIVGNL